MGGPEAGGGVEGHRDFGPCTSCLQQQRQAEERGARERKAKRSLTGKLSDAFGELKLRQGT